MLEQIVYIFLLYLSHVLTIRPIETTLYEIVYRTFLRLGLFAVCFDVNQLLSIFLFKFY